MQIAMTIDPQPNVYSRTTMRITSFRLRDPLFRLGHYTQELRIVSIEQRIHIHTRFVYMTSHWTVIIVYQTHIHIHTQSYICVTGLENRHQQTSRKGLWLDLTMDGFEYCARENYWGRQMTTIALSRIKGKYMSIRVNELKTVKYFCSSMNIFCYLLLYKIDTSLIIFYKTTQLYLIVKKTLILILIECIIT